MVTVTLAGSERWRSYAGLKEALEKGYCIRNVQSLLFKVMADKQSKVMVVLTVLVARLVGFLQ